jgi:hypothetical protein
MKTVNLISLSIVGFLLSIFFFSCSKNDMAGSNGAVPTGQQNVSVYLTDNPGFFDKVLIDIRSVQALVDTCTNNNDRRNHDTCNVWESLNVTPGIYDLLTLRNGSDTLLAGSNIPAGEISLIKLTLGPDDSLVKDSVSYPLNIHDSTVVLVDVHGKKWDEFKPGHFRLWLDFDVSRSIIQVRNNEFFLSPFIRVFTVSSTGSVAGSVGPWGAFPVITVSNSTDTGYALPDRFGNFEVRGLDPGTYNVFVNASNGYADTTITGVNVTAGKQDWLGNIKLHQ